MIRLDYDDSFILGLLMFLSSCLELLLRHVNMEILVGFLGVLQ